MELCIFRRLIIEVETEIFALSQQVASNASLLLSKLSRCDLFM